MALPNETSVLSSNGEATTQSTKQRKAAKKSGASSVREPAASSAKRPVSRTSGPVETLFDQEPNPFRAAVPPFIWIDFPTQSETLFAPTYVIRLGVGGAEAVEISVDKSPWLPCRLTSGYWWYDWSNIVPGKHTLVARMRTSGNQWFKTPPRLCTYRR